jgi:CheY-like chemotaxis protein
MPNPPDAHGDDGSPPILVRAPASPVPSGTASQPSVLLASRAVAPFPLPAPGSAARALLERIKFLYSQLDNTRADSPQYDQLCAQISELSAGVHAVQLARSEHADGAPRNGPPRRTILVVDDEPSIRRITRLFLERVGYEVFEAASAFAAMGLLDAGRSPDLLISDLRMPGLNGDEMVSRLRVTRPQLKVLYISGYSELLATLRPSQNDAILEKPFTVATLEEAVSALLRRAA